MKLHTEEQNEVSGSRINTWVAVVKRKVDQQ